MFEKEVQNIIETICKFQSDGKKICATSSFQTQSIPLLHILSQLKDPIDILFIDTGFLFPDTYHFKNALVQEFNLKVVSVFPNVSKIQQLKNGSFLFASNPDLCCKINKVDPLNPFMNEYDIWISGVRADQNENRKNLSKIQETNSKALRYHPMLLWTKQMIYTYINTFNLPKHPLYEKGYISVGCEPCTQNPEMQYNERGGRWQGVSKTECGLHTELIKNK